MRRGLLGATVPTVNVPAKRCTCSAQRLAVGEKAAPVPRGKSGTKVARVSTLPSVHAPSKAKAM